MAIQLAVSPAGFLGAPWGHFQIVGPDGNEIEVQAGSHWNVTFRDHDGFIDNPFPLPDTPHTYGISNGVIEQGYYNAVNLPGLDSQTEAQQWALINNIASAIETVETQIQYNNAIDTNENGNEVVLESGTQNSNTFVSTLLYVIGVDLVSYVPSILTGLNFQSVPGYSHNVLFDPISGDPISLSFSGSSGNDLLRLGLARIIHDAPFLGGFNRLGVAW
ncbi:MAG: hypothetical protein GY717_06705, partial [Rhodobacteraceae bacterium]|nr:hypothetical protein [Paracoccaceae bacterium]